MGAKVGKGEEYGFILRFYNKGLRVLRHVLRQLIVKTMEKAEKGEEYGFIFAKMKPYSSPFSAFSIVFTISCLKTCLKTRSPLL